MTKQKNNKEKKSKRLDELLEISARLFFEKSYAATSMQDIALEAGLLKGSLYHYIDTKEDLLWMISEPTLARLISSVGDVINTPGLPFVDRLRAAVRVHVGMFHSHGPFMAVLAHEGIALLRGARQQELARLQKTYFELWRNAFREAKNSGEVDPSVNPSILSLANLGMMNWMLRWYDVNGQLDPDEIADQFAELLIRGFQLSNQNST